MARSPVWTLVAAIRSVFWLAATACGSNFMRVSRMLRNGPVSSRLIQRPTRRSPSQGGKIGRGGQKSFGTGEVAASGGTCGKRASMIWPKVMRASQRAGPRMPGGRPCTSFSSNESQNFSNSTGDKPCVMAAPFTAPIEVPTTTCGSQVSVCSASTPRTRLGGLLAMTWIS